MARIIVSGGAGFIGRHLCKRLVGDGHSVTVVDYLEPQAESVVPPDVVIKRISVGNHDGLLGLMTGTPCDAFVHLGAAVGVGQSMYAPAAYVVKNTLATATMLEVFQKLNPMERPKRLVVASSMSVYGEGPQRCDGCSHVSRPLPRSVEQLEAHVWDAECPICRHPMIDPFGAVETFPLLPRSPYAITKRDQEELCLILGEAMGIPTVALRFFNVYGNGQALSNPYTGVAAIFASQILNGRRPQVYEDGQQSRDFVHVSDIVDGIILAIESDVCGPINLGTGIPTTLASLAGVLCDELGFEPEIVEKARLGDVRHCIANPRKAVAELGWNPKVAVADGFRALAREWAEEKPLDWTDQARSELVSRGLLR